MAKFDFNSIKDSIAKRNPFKSKAEEDFDEEGSFDDEQKLAGDVNGDNKIDAKDATIILSYYSYRSTGGDKDLIAFFVS